MFDFLGSLAGGALDIIRQVAIPLAIGAGVKHLGSVPLLGKVVGVVTNRIPNNAIPLINLAASAVIPGFGPVAALSASGLHQIVKIGARSVIEKFTKSSAVERVETAIGPGTRLSI